MNSPGKPAAPNSAPDSGPVAVVPAKARVIDIADPMIGKRLAHFEVRSRLGQGENGVVYLAQDLNLHQTVAIKVLRRPLDADGSPGGDIVASARHQATVTHQKVAQVRYIGDDNGRSFIVTEYMQGRTLKSELQRAGAMPWADAVACVVEIVQALEAAQAVGLPHGALSSSNVFLHRHADAVETSRADVKVVDFGMGAATDDETANPYLAPERHAGGPADMRGDMFSLGVLFHEMLTAAPPEPGRAVPDGAAPPYIRRLVAFLMRADARQRPSSYEELLGRLEVALIKPTAVSPLLARTAAFSIDLFLMALCAVGLGFALPRVGAFSTWESQQLGLILFAGYWIVTHKVLRQSLGKQFCGVKLQKARAGLGWGRVIARFLVQFWGPIAAVVLIDLKLGRNPDPTLIQTQVGPALWVIGLFWLAGFLVVLTDRKGQGLHDHATDTSVVAA